MKKLVFVIFIFLLICIIGCQGEPEIKETPSYESLMIIEPSNLFERASTKQEMQLSFVSECVKIKYNGAKTCLRTELEIWENGDVKESHRLMGVYAIETDKDSSLNGEVSFSFVQNDISGDGKLKINSVYTDKSNVAMGQMTSLSDEIEFPKTVGVSFSLNNNISISDEEQVYLWVYTDADNEVPSDKDIYEIVKNAKYAVTYKLYLTDK